MDTHLLTRGLQPAECDHPWSEMDGTETTRTCTACSHTVYKVEGLTEDQLVSLICPKHSVPDNPATMYRRADGTIATTCGWQTKIPPSRIASKLFVVLLSGVGATAVLLALSVAAVTLVVILILFLSSGH